MGGYQSSIYVNKELTSEDKLYLTQTIERISIWTEGNQFSVNDTAAIGGNYFGTAYPFKFDIIRVGSEDCSLDTFQLKQIEQLFDFIPQVEVALRANCSGFESQRILGELTLYLSRYFQGLVDFCGTLLPGSIYQKYDSNWLEEEATWEDLKGDFWYMIKGCTGKIESIQYETAGKKVGVKHVCDPEFMSNWLHHENFQMIK
jgi:hypothetical protein